MSDFEEYIGESCGYDESGQPASITQFSFGVAPFTISEDEKIEDVTKIDAIAQTDAIVEIKIIDGILSVSWDFTNDIETLVELYEKFEEFKLQEEHSHDVLTTLITQMKLAEETKDQAGMEKAIQQMRLTSVPFMLPTIVPNKYNGSVHIGFKESPKYFYFTSDIINATPTKLVAIFASNEAFYEDDAAIEELNYDAEMALMQEEAYYDEIERQMEENAYMNRYNNSLYDETDEDRGNEKLKGVRIKK